MLLLLLLRLLLLLLVLVSRVGTVLPCASACGC
jgi:hypothetical protein